MALGNFGSCTSSNPCGEDQGDCDLNSHCIQGHMCGTDNCRSSLGFESFYDCCYSLEEDFCTIEYGTLLGGSSLEFFKNSRIDVYAKMYEFMQNKPYVMVNSTREGVEYVRDSEGRYAFFLEAALNDYYNGRYPCDTMMVGKNLDYKGKYFKP